MKLKQSDPQSPSLVSSGKDTRGFLGSKILKSRFSCDLLISAMFLIEDIFTASRLGLVDIKEDRLGSSLTISSGMAVEKTQKIFQFR